MRFRLTERAQSDLIDIYVFGAATFGERQADRYYALIREGLERIADFPLANRERRELEPPTRIVLIGSHIALYRIVDDVVLVLRIVHGHHDWQNDL